VSYDQVRSQVWGTKYISGVQDFCSYYIYKTKLSEHNYIWGARKLGALLPIAPPRDYAPQGHTWTQLVFHIE